MYILKKCTMGFAVAALLCGTIPTANAQILNRALLSTTFANDGRDAGTVPLNASRRLDYPRSWASPGLDVGGLTTGPNPPGYFDNAAGHGFFVMTQRGGQHQTVWTGPRTMPTSFGRIFPMQYNPRTDGPEAHLGTETFEVRGQVYRPGNWWPTREPFDAQSRAGVNIYNHRFYDYIPDRTFPEQIIINKWTTSQGITFVRKAYGWSYEDFDDFIIQEVEFTNTGDSNGDGMRNLPEETLTSVYVSIVQWMGSSGGESQNIDEGWWRFGPAQNDDWLVYSDAPNYPVDPVGLSGKRVPPGLKLTFVYDGDHPETPHEDTGGPMPFSFLSTQKLAALVAIVDGQLNAFQFVGLAPLAFSNTGAFAFVGRDAGKGYVEPAGDQPSSVKWYRSISQATQQDPQEALHNAKTMQDMLTGAIAANPTDVGFYFSAQTYGPYTLAPGESGKIVFAYVAGAASQMLGEDMLTWAFKGNQNEVPLGQDAMLQNLEAARFAYKNGYVVPSAPPDVAFDTRFSPRGHMEVFWPDRTDRAVNPDYTGAAAQDIIGYEIFRSTYLPAGPWVKVADIAKGSASGGFYVFEDEESLAGFGYRYAVRAVASGKNTWAGGNATLADLPAHIQASVKAGLKGGIVAPFQREFGDKSPVQVSFAEADRLERRVQVVPNPFVLVSDASRYPGSVDKIRFVNIPHKCEVYVYTTTGDLAIKLNHDNPNIAEISWDFKVGNMITIAGAGIYYYVVRSLVPGSEGKLQRGTFYVIR